MSREEPNFVAGRPRGSGSPESVARARLALELFLAERRKRKVPWQGTMSDRFTYRENKIYLRRVGDRDGLWQHD